MYQNNDPSEAYAHLLQEEYTPRAYHNPIVETEHDLARITEPGIDQIEKTDEDLAVAIRVVRDHAGYGIRNFQCLIAHLSTWLQNCKSERQQQVSDLGMRQAQEENRKDDAIASREVAVGKRNVGIVESGFPYVEGNTPEALEEGLQRKQPPAEAMAPGPPPTDPATPSRKTIGDLFLGVLAPLSSGFLVGVCLFSIALPVTTQLMRGEVTPVLIAAVVVGTTVVTLIGKCVSNVLQSWLVTDRRQTTQFPRFWVHLNRLQVAITCLILVGEISLEANGIQDLHQKVLMDNARFGSAAGAPHPMWIYITIASLISLPYIAYKLSCTKLDLENRVRWSGVVASIYEWSQRERSTPNYKQAYLASLEILDANAKEEKANAEIARLNAERDAAKKEPDIPDHLLRGLMAASATVRGAQTRVFMLIESGLRKTDASIYGNRAIRRFARSAGLRPLASNVFRGSRSLIESADYLIDRIGSRVRGLFRRKRRSDNADV